MDTIIIKIYGLRYFRVINKSWFVPEFEPRSYAQLSPTEKQNINPSRIYLRHFIFKPPYQNDYLPRIEIFEALTKDRNAVHYVLKATFSLPKLLHKNSLQETSSEIEFEQVLHVLKKSFGSAGIETYSNAIENARVSAVHFCKNVLLPRDIRMQEALTELQRVDINKVVDITLKEEKNGGRWLHIYSGTIERVFYDKVADAMRPKGKRKDKGRIDHERNVIERYGLQGREVFRYEYRVKKTQTVMREINRALGREPKAFIIFKDLFTPNLCKTVIRKSWNELIRRPENQLALLGPTDNLALFLHILAQAKKSGGSAHSMNRAFISYGLTRAIRDHGAKEVRRAIFTTWNTDHSERLTQKIEMSARLAKGLPYSNTIAFIDKAFEQFELITLDFLVNNV